MESQFKIKHFIERATQDDGDGKKLITLKFQAEVSETFYRENKKLLKDTWPVNNWEILAEQQFDGDNAGLVLYTLINTSNASIYFKLDEDESKMVEQYILDHNLGTKRVFLTDETEPDKVCNPYCVNAEELGNLIRVIPHGKVLKFARNYVNGEYHDLFAIKKTTWLDKPIIMIGGYQHDDVRVLSAKCLDYLEENEEFNILNEFIRQYFLDQYIQDTVFLKMPKVGDKFIIDEQVCGDINLIHEYGGLILKVEKVDLAVWGVWAKDCPYEIDLDVINEVE